MTPEEIKEARFRAGLTLREAADLVRVNIRTWQKWEAGERSMHPAFWELFTLKCAARTD